MALRPDPGDPELKQPRGDHHGGGSWLRNHMFRGPGKTICWAVDSRGTSPGIPSRSPRSGSRFSSAIRLWLKRKLSHHWNP